jgi:hypothetical protein
MSQLLPCERGPHVTLLVRSHSLRRRAEEVMERAASLRERSGQLLRAPGGPRPPGHQPPAPDGEAQEDAEALQWYRVQVRQMLAAGWSSAELADVGVTDGLLRELGLHAAE